MRLKALEAIRPFKVGDRVRLSAAGRTRRPRKTQNSGLVVGYSENGVVVRIVFDGQKTPSRLHASLLELVAVAAPDNASGPPRVDHEQDTRSIQIGPVTFGDRETNGAPPARMARRVATNERLIDCLEEIAGDHDLLARLARENELRRCRKRSSRKMSKPVDRIALRRDQFALEKKIALGGQRIARQKGLIARIERLGSDTKLARELLTIFEQTQSLFEQHRRHVRQARPSRRARA